MTYSYSGTLTFQFNSLSDLNAFLSEIQNDPVVTNLTHDNGLLTITADINVTGL